MNILRLSRMLTFSIHSNERENNIIVHLTKSKNSIFFLITSLEKNVQINFDYFRLISPEIID